MKITHIVPSLVFITVEACSKEEANAKLVKLAGGVLHVPNCATPDDTRYDMTVAFSLTQLVAQEDMPGTHHPKEADSQ